MTVQNPYDQLGVTPDAGHAEVKAAYHRKLRQYPPHSHPVEFRGIRAAYESILAAVEQRGDPLQPGPLLASLDSSELEAIETRLRAAAGLTLDDLLRLSF